MISLMGLNVSQYQKSCVGHKERSQDRCKYYYCLYHWRKYEVKHMTVLAVCYLHGVAAQIQEATPSALYVQHIVQTCALQTVGGFCNGCNLFRFSPKHSSLFDTLQSQLSPGSPSLKPTRWTVQTCALHSTTLFCVMYCINCILRLMMRCRNNEIVVEAKFSTGLTSLQAGGSGGMFP